MGKKIGIFCAILLTFLAFYSCKNETQSCDLVILYTTDVHGNVLPYDFNKNIPNETSLANASMLIKDLSEKYGKNLFLLDAGDFFQGTPSMYYYNYYSTNEKHLISRVANYFKYSLLVYGNHDMETGETKLEEIDRDLNMPRMGGNILMNDETGRTQVMFRPYKIFERDGFNIAVLGLITPETGEQIPKSLIPHMRFETMIEYANKWVKEIREYENVDYTVCVLHAGLKDIDLITENNDTIHDGLSYIVNNVRGIDLLLFGHDHGVYQGDLVNQWSDTVKLLQPAAYGEEIGKINVHLERDKNMNLSKRTETELISLKGLPIDKKYMAEFNGVIDSVNAFLNRPFGTLVEELDMIGTIYKQTNTMNFVHGIQLKATGAEISFSSALSTFRDLAAGPITARTLFSLYKYDNMLHKMWMTGYEVKSFLEYGYERQFGIMHDETDHLLAFKYEKNGKISYGRFGPELVTPQYNYTSAAGINYEVDVRKPYGSRVRIVSMADGTPFDLNRQYTVAISSYQAAGGGGFVNRGLGWSQDDIAYHTLSISSKTITKIIADHLQETLLLDPAFLVEKVGQWKVLPEDWATQMGERDARLLLPYIAK